MRLFKIQNKVMKYFSLLLLVGLLFSGKISAQDKRTYTLTIDPTKAVQPYTATDGLNFYILQEQAGDKCITCLSVRDSLEKRSIALQSIVPNIEKLNVAMLDQNTNLQNENKTILSQLEQTTSLYKQEKQISSDLEEKNKFYQDELKRRNRNKWVQLTLVGVAGVAAGIVINSVSGN